MTKRTETAATVHGDVQYTVVECSSCGEEVREEDAYPFAIGGELREHGVTKAYIRYAYNWGYACEYCADNPLEFPQGDVRWADDNESGRLKRYIEQEDDWILYGYLVAFLFIVAVATVVMI